MCNCVELKMNCGCLVGKTPTDMVNPKVGETWVDLGGQKHLILHIHAHLYATVVYGSHYWLEREQLKKKYVEPIKHILHVYLVQGSGLPFINFSEQKRQIIGYKVLAYKQIEITEGEGV